MSINYYSLSCILAAAKDDLSDLIRAIANENNT